MTEINPKYAAFLADKSNYLSYLQEPFKAGKHTIYTNGFCMIVTDCPCDDDSAPMASKKSAEKLAEEARKNIESGEPFRIKPFAFKSSYHCEKCKGTGKINKCPECHGDGYVEFENDHNHYEFDCQTCGGNPAMEFECDEYHKVTPVNFFGEFVNPEFLNNALNLDNARFLPPSANFIDFVFDGGFGRIMTMTKCGNENIENITTIEKE